MPQIFVQSSDQRVSPRRKNVWSFRSSRWSYKAPVELPGLLNLDELGSSNCLMVVESRRGQTRNLWLSWFSCRFPKVLSIKPRFSLPWFRINIAKTSTSGWWGGVDTNQCMSIDDLPKLNFDSLRLCCWDKASFLSKGVADLCLISLNPLSSETLFKSLKLENKKMPHKSA